MDEKAYEKLSRWIVSEFPVPTTPNMIDALSMKLLQRLSSSLLFAEYPSAADTPPDLPAFWRKVELSFKVLQDLEANTKGSRIGKTAFPISRRRGEKMTGGSRVDLRHFDSMGINVPITDTEVREVYARVLSELQAILEVRGFMNVPDVVLNQPQYYLLVLRRPVVSEIFKSSYTKVNLAEETLEKERAPSPETKAATTTPNRPAGPTFPMIQPMKASLYFDDIEGFGEWAILLSTRAQKDLRDKKRSDPTTFRIVMKKIKYE